MTKDTAPQAAILAWLMTADDGDGSADWVEVGAEQPEPADGFRAVALVALDAPPVAPEQAGHTRLIARIKVCIEEVPLDANTEQVLIDAMDALAAKREPLSEANIHAMRAEAKADPRTMDQHWFVLFARAIERAHGIGVKD